MNLSRTYLAVLTAATIAIAPFPTGRLRIDAPVVPIRHTVLGYDRTTQFGGWATTASGCTTRDVALAEVWGEPCHVPHHDWEAAPVTDPFTGEPLMPADVELDHLYPLSAAWDMGAHAWDQQTRVAFANDPRNLVVTSSTANQAKGDKLPGEWLPPARRARCAYAQRLADVASAYHLPLDRADHRAMRRACAGFQGLLGASSL